MKDKKMSQQRNRRKTFSGIVVSDKMNKTRVVQVRWTSNHSMYNKQMRRAVKFKAHDEQNSSKAGDLVKIIETRPLSKDKRWAITEIIKS